MSDWQPIETAPKDGTEILVLDGDARVVMVWEWHAWRLAHAGAYVERDPEYPTHWMPLPAPPTVTP